MADDPQKIASTITVLAEDPKAKPVAPDSDEQPNDAALRKAQGDLKEEIDILVSPYSSWSLSWICN